MTDIQAVFDTIYATDLLFSEKCWALCGDAHCCTFSRYQRGDDVRQDLILLPLEYEYMNLKGYIEQYANLQHYAQRYALSHATLCFETLSIKSNRGGCPCTHEIRPTTCRLYPMLPVFELDVGLVGIERYYGLEDEIEKVTGMRSACRIESISPAERKNFLRITTAIFSEPNCLFHVMAYDCVRRHVQSALQRKQVADPIEPTTEGVSRARTLLGMDLLDGELFDVAELKSDLDTLAQRFCQKFGPEFQSSGLTRRPAGDVPEDVISRI